MIGIRSKAIKSGKTFAYLFIRRCANLTDPQFLSKKAADRIIDLGPHDPAKGTLFYAVYVAAKGKEFSIPKDAPYNYTVCDLETLRLIVIWTFLDLPPLDAEATFHNMTINQASPQTHALMDGYTAEECLETFQRMMAILVVELLDLLRKELADDKAAAMRITARITKDGLFASLMVPYSITDGLKDTQINLVAGPPQRPSEI